ncbi:MAG: glyceraldehyde 3-phosphate dehydrogenase NAD-binding domain-containing protein [Chthoniobacter sp.]
MASVASAASSSAQFSTKDFSARKSTWSAVNDLVPADNLAYLVKYDSTQGRYKGEVTSAKSDPSVAEDDLLVVDGHKIKALAVKEGPAALPWKALGVDIVLECTGLFTRCGEGQGAHRRRREESHHQRPGEE